MLFKSHTFSPVHTNTIIFQVSPYSSVFSIVLVGTIGENVEKVWKLRHKWKHCVCHTKTATNVSRYTTDWKILLQLTCDNVLLTMLRIREGSGEGWFWRTLGVPPAALPRFFLSAFSFSSNSIISRSINVISVLQRRWSSYNQQQKTLKQFQKLSQF